MNKNYIKFLEAKIYIEEKDGTCIYTNDLRRKYPEYVGMVDFANIYRRIVNYRIKKYGTSRIGYSDWDGATYEEKLKYGKKKQHEQTIRRKKYGIYD